jgi:hypothetical protein
MDNWTVSSRRPKGAANQSVIGRKLQRVGLGAGRLEVSRDVRDDRGCSHELES